ncbi:metallophosphoesterase [Roseibacterium elongatum DSM 19469]|uniref:Metallophosphoesterase n=1 Tax=Roseicyclus elongatus DSM 19469 TaxID=1294273 RepID=W8RPD3_9RHOB|nr:metallophosphoesterase family protein [Roseibacterium elongatum]AHM03004.1 metallophosphoesterase [Roseibacterium elongatum DSM 19469]
MLRSVRSLLGRKDRPVPATEAPEATARRDADAPRPDSPTYVVGDIHGRADLLELMLELIDAHIGGTGARDPRLVFVGDYVDRGPDSAEVLLRLRELTRDLPRNVTCLMGNHDRMMLDFLKDPATRGPRWLRAGGTRTLASFGIDPTPLGSGTSPDTYRAVGRQLRDALPEGHEAWLSDLPLSWHSGNLWVVHAGADPAHPMQDQSARVLLWGHPEFESDPRGDGVWIVHGHVEAELPHARDGRIAVDTAAWSSGRLTACAIRPDGRHDFLQT